LPKRFRIGVLTPSSNTALEPLTSRILSGLPEVTVHFARFKVIQIALSETALAQFDDERILQAAELLADAKVDVIGWSGTAAGWMGFEADEILCQRIFERTGVPATTSVLALNDIFARTGCISFALVSPYTPDVQDKIVANYAAAGYRCVAEQHLGLDDNFSFGDVSEATLTRMIQETAAAAPDAIVTFCTNLWAAHLVPELEQKLDVPIYDTVSTVLWKALVMGNIDPTRIAHWGRLFATSRTTMGQSV
jgi:maleate isomerase